MNRFIFGCVVISMLLTPIVVAADGVLPTVCEVISTEHAEIRAGESTSIILPKDPDSQSASTETPPVRTSSFTVTHIGPPPKPWFPQQ